MYLFVIIWPTNFPAKIIIMPRSWFRHPPQMDLSLVGHRWPPQTTKAPKAAPVSVDWFAGHRCCCWYVSIWYPLHAFQITVSNERKAASLINSPGRDCILVNDDTKTFFFYYADNFTIWDLCKLIFMFNNGRWSGEGQGVVAMLRLSCSSPRHGMVSQKKIAWIHSRPFHAVGDPGTAGGEIMDIPKTTRMWYPCSSLPYPPLCHMDSLHI